MTPEDRVTPKEVLKKQAELRARLAASKAEREQRDARIAAWRAERSARPEPAPAAAATVEEERSLEDWLEERRARRRVIEAEQQKAEKWWNDYRKHLQDRHNKTVGIGCVVWLAFVFLVAPSFGRDATVALGIVAGVAALLWQTERYERALLRERYQSLRHAVHEAASSKSLDKASEILNEAARVDELADRPLTRF